MVGREEGAAQGFGESDVARVVRCGVVPQLPCTAQEWGSRVDGEGEVQQIFDRVVRLCWRECTAGELTSDDRDGLESEQIGCRKRLSLDPCTACLAVRPAVGDRGSDHRGVNDEHVRPRSRRPHRLGSAGPLVGVRSGRSHRRSLGSPPSRPTGLRGTAAATGLRARLVGPVRCAHPRGLPGSERSACMHYTCMHESSVETRLPHASQPGRVAPAMNVDTMKVACRSRLRRARS